jgi:isopenicillin-N N-acyltransferase like protein
LNASNTEMPFKSATPVSIIAREILQYAKNISEAVTIAKSRTSFVSEQFLIGSALDGYAVIIEKSPSKMAVYKTYGNEIISANHFQTPMLASDKAAIRQRDETASGYRYQRVSELLSQDQKLTPVMVATILRDTKGHNGSNIGLGNEKSINQLIAHHSIIFAPQKKMVWISTSPYQLGEYIAYNLDSVFYGSNKSGRISESIPLLGIPADSAFLSDQYPAFVVYRSIHRKFARSGILSIDPDSLIQLNPEYYQPYIDAGNYWLAKGNKAKAKAYLNRALRKEVATVKERKLVEEKIKICEK